MDNARLFRMGGSAAIISGVSIIAGKILALASLDLQGEFMDYLSPLFGLPAVVATYLYHRDRFGFSGFVSFAILFLGISVVMCLDYFGAFILPYLPAGMLDELLEGPVGSTLAISGLIFLTGVILFGISVIRAGKLPLAGSIFFISGFSTVPFGEIFPEMAVSIGSVVAGVGLISWGYSLCHNIRKTMVAVE